MKKIQKTSEWGSHSLSYPKDRKKIIALLLREQGYLCAYTEDRFTVGYARDVEHYNPTLKGTPQDGPHNWYAVGHDWNMKKGKKWEAYQPMLHPTDETLEERVLYQGGNFYCAPHDLEAKNIIELLSLNDDELSEKRRKYAKRLARLEKEMPGGREALKKYLLKDPEEIYFRRVLEAEFGFDFSIEEVTP